MQVGVKNTIFTEEIITSFYWTSTAENSWHQLTNWGDYFFCENGVFNPYLHGQGGFSWCGSPTAELDWKKWPITQPHQLFWVQLKDLHFEYQLPKFGGKQSADSSAAADRYFPSADTFQLTCTKSGATSCDQSLQMFHWCFELLGAKISSNSV